MSKQSGDPNYTPAAPPVHLQRIDAIRTFELTENELDTLDQMVSDENRALGFLSLLGGVFASVMVTAATTSIDTAVRAGVVCAVLAVSGIGSAWFGAIYLRARKIRPAFIQKIRARGVRPMTPPAPGP